MVASPDGQRESFLGSGPRRERIARGHAVEGLPPEDLRQRPHVAGITGEADGLGEVRLGQIGQVAGDAAARGECPGQQCRVAELAGESNGLLGLIHAACRARPSVQHGRIGKRSGEHRRLHLGPALCLAAEHGVEPR